MNHQDRCRQSILGKPKNKLVGFPHYTDEWKPCQAILTRFTKYIFAEIVQVV